MPRWAAKSCIAAIMLAMSALSAACSAPTAIEGRWLAVDATLAGKPAKRLPGHVLRVESDRFLITKDGKLLFGGTVATNAAPTPPTVDFQQTETDTLAGLWRGIYALDRDNLTICDNAYDMKKPRAASFDDCNAEGYVTLRFTRMK